MLKVASLLKKEMGRRWKRVGLHMQEKNVAWSQKKPQTERGKNAWFQVQMINLNGSGLPSSISR